MYAVQLVRSKMYETNVSNKFCQQVIWYIVYYKVVVELVAKYTYE